MRLWKFSQSRTNSKKKTKIIYITQLKIWQFQICYKFQKNKHNEMMMQQQEEMNKMPKEEMLNKPSKNIMIIELKKEILKTV